MEHFWNVKYHIRFEDKETGGVEKKKENEQKTIYKKKESEKRNINSEGYNAHISLGRNLRMFSDHSSLNAFYLQSLGLQFINLTQIITIHKNIHKCM